MDGYVVVGRDGVIAQANEAIQKELDAVMDVLEEIQHNIPEGAYLRGMNALGALHKHKRTTLAARRPGDMIRCWRTLDEIEEEDEDLFDEIMEVADDIVMELCGEDSSIYTDTNHNLVHHAIQVIMARLFDDTHNELEVVRPVSCQCGWRGAQGNWDRHITNVRHQRWVNTRREEKSQKRLAEAREIIVARREPGIVYLNELHSTPESRIATVEAIHTAESSGDRVIFMCADGTMSWFA